MAPRPWKQMEEENTNSSEPCGGRHRRRDRLPCFGRGGSAWCQLAATWVLFTVSAGVYQVPATLLGGKCENATHACSLGEELGDIEPGMLGVLPAAFLLFKGFLALPVGFALRRWGTQRCIAAGTLTLLLATTLYVACTAFWQLVLLYCGFGIAYCLSGLTPVVVHVNGWFEAHRKATSIGLLTSGFSAAGVLWPVVTASLAERYGWRVAASLLPVATLLVALPISVWVLRDGSIGASLSPPPNREIASEMASAPAEGECAPTEAIPRCEHYRSTPPSCVSSERALSGRQRLPPWAWDAALWHLAGMSLEVLYIVNGVVHFLVMYLTAEAGLSLTAAGAFSSLTFALSVVGKLLFGYALDQPSQRRYALLGCILLTVGGALTVRPVWDDAGLSGPANRSSAHGGLGRFTLRHMRIAPMESTPQLVAFAVAFGLGYGATFTLVQSRAAQLYGGEPDFKLVQSALAVVQYVGSFLGVALTSQLAQLCGSFVRAFAVFPVLGVLACLHCVCLFVPHPTRRPIHLVTRPPMPLG